MDLRFGLTQHSTPCSMMRMQLPRFRRFVKLPLIIYFEGYKNHLDLLFQRLFSELVRETSQLTGNKLCCFYLGKVVRPWRKMRFDQTSFLCTLVCDLTSPVQKGSSCTCHQFAGWQFGFCSAGLSSPKKLSVPPIGWLAVWFLIWPLSS